MSESRHSFPKWTPPEIIATYSEKNINSLFDWQVELLEWAETNDDNIVYSAPTSAGKSVVAELIALRVALTGKRVLFLLPYISVAKEKLRFLQRAWRRVDIQLAAFVGAQSAPSREWTAAVCTTEKANSLLNHAILDGLMNEIGLVVIDELHMVFDPSRGVVLESLCAKINLWNSRNPPARIRVIGMSATLENLVQVGFWLKAKVFETDFRPVELHERICCEGHISDLNTGSIIRDVPKRFRVSDDPECVLGLAAEGIFLKKLVLVFSSSKADVEKIALDLAKILDGIYRSNHVIASRVNRSALSVVQANIQRSAGAVDVVLAQTLPRGVAFHHAGLTSEERECVEQGFRDGVIMVLVATSTLSSGVNLPAGRVVIKAQIRGPASINATTYKQMSGRAGRLGHVEIGESILAVKKSDLQEVRRLIKFASGTTKQMVRDNTRLTLECICDGLATNTQEVEEIAHATLCKPIKSTENVLCDLVRNRFVTVDEMAEDQCFSSLTPTQLGRATLASALPPDAALFVFADLQQATKAIVLDTELHMLYLVTPTNCSVWQGCDWNHLHAVFSKLKSEERRVAKLVGANDGFIMSRLRGINVANYDRNYQLHLRFFSALALFDVVNEKPIDQVAARFRISRGTLQTLQQQSATYAAMVVSFCSRLGWTYLHDLLKGFAARLAFGVRRELTELVSIEGLDASRARIFHDHDITSFAQLSNCSAKKIAEILSLAVPFNSGNSSDGLNEWLFGEPRMRLGEAAELLRERAELSVKEHLRSLGLIVDNVKQLSQRAISGKDDFIADQRQSFSMVNGDKKGVAIGEFRGSSSEEFPPEVSANRSTAQIPENDICDSLELVDSILEENSVDLFSESMEEMTIEEKKPLDRLSVVDLEEQTEEIDDLESSLLKVSMICCDKENQKPNSINELLADSSPESYSKETFGNGSIPTFADSGYASTEFCSSLTTGRVLNDQTNIAPSHPSQHHPSSKRTRKIVMTNSPSCASPLGKASRFEHISNSVSAPAELNIDDVCRTESAWNYFIQRSSLWAKVGVALATRRNDVADQQIVLGISFCTHDGSPHYIPLSEEYFPGSEEEEVVCPSFTPSQSISLEERMSCVKSILQSCEISFVDALRDCYLLWNALKLKVLRPTCVSYMAFLCHMRAGDRPLSIREIISKFKWDFDVRRLLQMNPRISAAAQSYLAPRLIGRLSTLVVNCSSADSLWLEARSLQVVNSVCLGGFFFDNELCASLVQKLKKKAEHLEHECFELAGRNFNLDSPSQVAEVLFTRLKLSHPGGKTTKKHMSTNKTVLEEMKTQHPIVDNILQYRRLRHAIGQTLKQCIIPLQRFVSDDGFVRSRCDIHTSTGRILCLEPNLQTIPKDTLIDGIGLRDLFRAQRGCVLVSADYSQLELRVLAHLSEDSSLIEHLSDDRDIFAELSSMWQVSRDSVKKLCYGIIYGMGCKTLSETLKKTAEEGNELMQNFFKTFPKVRSYINQTKEKSVNVGFVCTFLGRRRVTCSARGRQEDVARDDRQSINYTIQGTASEIFKKALVKLEETRQGATRVVLTIHDEIIVECAAEEEQNVKLWLRDCMQNVFPDFKVPLPVKIRTGLNWGSLF